MKIVCQRVEISFVNLVCFSYRHIKLSVWIESFRCLWNVYWYVTLYLVEQISHFSFERVLVERKYAIISWTKHTQTILAKLHQEVTDKIVAIKPRVAPVINKLLQIAPLISSATGYSTHNCSCKKTIQGMYILGKSLNILSSLMINTYPSTIAFNKMCYIFTNVSRNV